MARTLQSKAFVAGFLLRAPPGSRLLAGLHAGHEGRQHILLLAAATAGAAAVADERDIHALQAASADDISEPAWQQEGGTDETARQAGKWAGKSGFS